jgi:hypothetical protein
MSPASIKFQQSLIRLLKGMLTAWEDFLQSQNHQQQSLHS